MSPTVATAALLLYIATVLIFAVYSVVLKLEARGTRQHRSGQLDR